MEEHTEKKEHHIEKKEHHPNEEGKAEIKITFPEIKHLNWAKVSTAAAVILLIIVVFQAYQANSLMQKISEMEAKTAEASKLPAIEVTAIEADCAQCAPIASILAGITPSQANITKSQSLSPTDSQAQRLIAQYGIKRLPTVVITGEAAKLKLSDAAFETVGDALVYNPAAPYVDAATGAVKGLVTLTLVNASGCTQCSDLTPAVKQLRSLVAVKEVKVVDKDSTEGKALAEKYSMERLPALFISNEVSEYQIASQLAQAGTLEQDGTIVIGANPPYLNISTGKVAGIAKLTLLNDSSCIGCYDVTFHESIVKGTYGVYLESVKAVDTSSAEGKALIAKYKITAAPTIILAGDLSPYISLNAIWKTVGTVESDGTYVFRAMGAIAGRPYLNLTTGNIEANAAPSGQ